MTKVSSFLHLIFTFLCLVKIGDAQSLSIFSNTYIPEVRITIPKDSLDVLLSELYSDYYFKAAVNFNYPNGGDRMESVGLRLRGNSSRKSAKKSFKISFNEFIKGAEYQGVKKLNFNAQVNDPSLIREKLFYDCWKHFGLPERRTSFVKLFVNNEYYGLYTCLEEIDKNWLQKNFNDNNGNLYKCTYPADLVSKGTDPNIYKTIMSSATTGGRAYELQTNKTADNYTDLAQLIALINKSSDNQFVKEINAVLNVKHLLKAYALEVMCGHWDDYGYNKNNYFLYHDSTTLKFNFVSYDADNTFGIDWVGVDWALRDHRKWYNTKSSEKRPLISKLLAVAEFNQLYVKYLDTLANQILLPSRIFPYIDSLHLFITPAAELDLYRTYDYQYTIKNFHDALNIAIDGHTPYGIKPFIEKRRQTYFLHVGSQPVANDLQIECYPNPCHDFIYLKCDQLIKSYILYNGQGQEMKSAISHSSKVKISLDGLHDGIYFIKAINHLNEIQVIKMIKK
ncbi:MAG TPA: CotH kinase family protein [Saprospiraceae bacterium]|nr:CotH kinase family protein [Saprospiraceae bacterium]